MTSACSTDRSATATPFDVRLDPPASDLDLFAQHQDLPNPYGRVTRCDLTARSTGADTTVSDLPTVVACLPAGDWTAHWFSSDWGLEFTPQSRAVTERIELGITSGRSSKGVHPWLCLVRAGDEEAWIISPAWSGNWRIVAEPDDGGVRVSAGISPWRFERVVTADRPFAAPTVYVAVGTSRSTAAAALAAAVSRWVAPRSAFVPLTWNHWWPYEDREIDAATFVANAGIAADLGYELAVLDAGWFGTADPDSDWWKIRGDWHAENTVRFPEGTAGVAEATRAAGVHFGIWCEVEALGDDSTTAGALPEIVARRDNDPNFTGARADDPGWLGYVCLGSPAGRRHVAATLDRLVDSTGARWLKVDFNLDPGPGCSRTDHGHDAGDGLYEHYRGLYEVLDVLRTRHPQLIVEDCSSGGLRLDLGLLSHVHCGFLSDPDWTEFQVQLLWGVSQLLPAASIFHFSESQWRTFHRFQHLDPKTMDADDFDASIRAVMLHRFALSLKLPEVPDVLREHLRVHGEVYRAHVVPALQAHAVIRPLTDQPLMDGAGERWPAYQLCGGPAELIMSVRLDGAPGATVVRPVGLQSDARYRVSPLAPRAHASDLSITEASGAELMQDGIGLRPTAGARSWLLRLEVSG